MKQKLLLIISGLLAAVLLSEASFRIGGLIVHETGNQSDGGDNNTHRILCIGDSSTYGIGASDVNTFSYPSQLQKIFEENIPHKKFEVINLGVPGINSSQVLNRLRNNILEYKPDTVIVMVGINDPWNLEESNILKFYNAGVFKRLYLRFEFFLNKLRLYRFFNLVYISRNLRQLKTPHFNDAARSRGFIFSLQNQKRTEALYNAIFNNINEMKLIAEYNHVNIIFMKYHNIGWGRPEIIIHRVYDRLEVSIVDNQSLFIKADRIRLNVRGSDNWHPNDLGYKLIAKNVYNKMASLGLVDGEPVEIFK